MILGTIDEDETPVDHGATISATLALATISASLTVGTLSASVSGATISASVTLSE